MAVPVRRGCRKTRRRRPGCALDCAAAHRRAWRRRGSAAEPLVLPLRGRPARSRPAALDLRQPHRGQRLETVHGRRSARLICERGHGSGEVAFAEDAAWCIAAAAVLPGSCAGRSGSTSSLRLDGIAERLGGGLHRRLAFADQHDVEQHADRDRDRASRSHCDQFRPAGRERRHAHLYGSSTGLPGRRREPLKRQQETAARPPGAAVPVTDVLALAVEQHGRRANGARPSELAAERFSYAAPRRTESADRRCGSALSRRTPAERLLRAGRPSPAAGRAPAPAACGRCRCAVVNGATEATPAPAPRNRHRLGRGSPAGRGDGARPSVPDSSRWRMDSMPMFAGGSAAWCARTVLEGGVRGRAGGDE